MGEALRVSSGVGELDRLLGGLFIGDNVVWHDAAGSLASVFCLNFIRTSQAQGKPIIYVTFDRSPKSRAISSTRPCPRSSSWRKSSAWR